MPSLDDPTPAAAPRRWRLRRLTLPGLLVTVGYVLSPLSWWNDAFVNLPLAYGAGVLVSLVAPRLFGPAVVTAYWLTNVLGLFMIHKGVVTLTCKLPPCRYNRRMLAKDLAVSLVYTAAIAALVRFGALAPPAELLRRLR